MADTERPKRAKRDVDLAQYGKFARRVLAAYGRRVADADEVDLAELVQMRVEIDEALTIAIAGMRARKRPWSYIAQGLGITRQSACNYWLPKIRILESDEDE